MASQVLAFLRRSRRETDWSQEEIAELYRIEHALLQARFSLETDRGVSDEGDPWFVFCRADGEVLVHITRSEDGYLLYGLGLPRPLTGRVIGDISKSFVNQIPLNIPVKRADGPQLFVHPAAALAIIIGMVFLANDDVALVSSDHQAATASGSEGAEPLADRGVKALVLAIFGKFADGTLFGGERVEASHQEGAYLNIVCTIAAVMMGASVALDSASDDVIPSVSEDAVVAAEPAHAQQSSSDHTDIDASDGDPLAAVYTAAATALVPLEDDANVAATVSPAAVVDATHDIRPPTPAADPGVTLDHEKANLTSDLARLDQPRPTIQPEAAGHAPVASAPVAVSEPVPETSKPVASSAPAPAATAHAQEPGATSADDTFQHLLKSVGLPDNAQAERVLSHTSLEILQSIPASAVPVAQDAKGDTKSGVTGDPKGDTKSDGAAAPVEAAHGTLYPVFDSAAQSVLTQFLQSNPDSQAFFYDHSVVIWDGDSVASHVTVQVWELDGGATIAIVGHADNPAAHA